MPVIDIETKRQREQLHRNKAMCEITHDSCSARWKSGHRRVAVARNHMEMVDSVNDAKDVAESAIRKATAP